MRIEFIASRAQTGWIRGRSQGVSQGVLKSLDQFVAEKGTPAAVRFDAAPPITQSIRTAVQRGGTQAEVAYRLVSLPLYLVERLPALLAALPP